MGICPRCGSWVDDGDVCRSCGGVREVKKPEPSCGGNVTIKSPEDLYWEKVDADADKYYEDLVISKGKANLVRIKKYPGEFHTDNGFFYKLVKENDGSIKLRSTNKEIGYVLDNKGSMFEKYFSSPSELKNLSKISYAKYFCRYPGRYNRYLQAGFIIAELLDDNSPIKHKAEVEFKKRERKEELINRKEELINKYAKKELITIAGTSFHKAVKFEEGMELKLVKEPDNSYDKDAIAVYFGDDKVGYVANSKKTNLSKTSMASELKNLPNVSYAKYLMKSNSYHIARLRVIS